MYKEIFQWSEDYGANVDNPAARKWFNQNWHSLNIRINEIQRVVREMEPILIEKKYMKQTTLEMVQQSQATLAYYGDKRAVEKEYAIEPPTNDAEAKEWCYERKGAYEADKKMRALYEGYHTPTLPFFLGPLFRFLRGSSVKKVRSPRHSTTYCNVVYYLL